MSKEYDIINNAYKHESNMLDSVNAKPEELVGITLVKNHELNINILLTIAKYVKEQILSKYKTLDGKCYEACMLFIETVKPVNCTVTLEHGEINHLYSIPSKYWGYQHTWLKVESASGNIYYIDITIKQFEDIFINSDYTIEDDIYLSTVKPIYFLNDKDNIRWNKKIKNNKIGSFIEFIQYNVKGKVYDFLRKLELIFNN